LKRGRGTYSSSPSADEGYIDYIQEVSLHYKNQLLLLALKKASWLGDSYSYLIGKYGTIKVAGYNFVFWFNESRKIKSKGMKMEQSCNLEERGLSQLVPFMLHTLHGTTKKSFINTAIRSAQIIDAKLCSRSSMILHQRRRSQFVELYVAMNSAS